MLELTKGQAIDLNKEAGKTLSKLRLGAGWDVSSGKTLDLDLWLIPKGGAPVYYNNKTVAGVTLDKDDRTGASSSGGADENINIDVAALAQDEYVVMVNIYDAVRKGQFFKDVQRAFIEVVDAETNNKVSNFNISENGGDNFSLIAGKITKANGGLTFTAMADFSTKDAGTLVKEYGGNV